MPNIKNRIFAAATVGLLVSAGAHAELVEIRWSDTGRFEHAAAVAPGKFAEVCGKLAKGQAVAWSFKTDRPMQFNIHYHEGKKVEYPAKLDGAKAAEGQLNAALDQDYCWMWTNKTEGPAALTLVLQK